jgi:4-aminobutyrate aminotransferase/diaminobutyrate-pyruvate transaminase/4-aminobutyrate aminotransferase/(S)-3-amino-2-methylpropionate transaminase
MDWISPHTGEGRKTMAVQPLQDLTPRDVPPVETKYRRIRTPIPVPESVPILEKLRRHEPRSMGGQPLVLWDRAEGIQVHDRWGNMWLDWSSGVLVANAGHNHPKIARAMRDQIDHGLVHNYCFPSELRAELAGKLAEVAPKGLGKVFLLTTGSEATECAIKLARTWGEEISGREKGGNEKIGIVTFQNAFHGRTLGAQMAGGIPALKEWIVNLDRDMVQVPFPDGFRGPDTSFDGFLKALADAGVTPDRIAGVMTETYQGGNSSFAPPEYVQKLRQWCDEHRVVMIFDEIQAGFGRTGTYWGFEHYDVVPDLICCGKGISSGMPISAVLGRPDIMDLYPPGSMTSTHTGNPVCVAASLANLQVIEEENLVENSRRMGDILQDELRRIGRRFAEHIGAVHGKGLVAALHMVKPGGIDPNPQLATRIVNRSVEKGLLMFAPVGFGGASVKIAPPLVIDEEPLRESITVLEKVIEEVLA